jgi:hypothetical protein
MTAQGHFYPKWDLDWLFECPKRLRKRARFGAQRRIDNRCQTRAFGGNVEAGQSLMPTTAPHHPAAIGARSLRFKAKNILNAQSAKTATTVGRIFDLYQSGLADSCFT